MTSRRFTIWRRLAALAPALLLLVYLPGQLMLRCRIDGLLHPACCCGGQNESPSAGPTAKAQDCCDPESTAAVRPPAEAARATQADLSLPSKQVISSLLAVVLAPQARSVLAWGRHGPPHRPPILLVKQSLLI